MSLCLNGIIICYLLLFTIFFTPIASRYKYNTRLSSKSAFCIPTARTNYEKFNIRFKGAVLWNNIEASLKLLRFHKFKCSLINYLIYTSSLLQSI